jgi:hypothetical protein
MRTKASILGLLAIVFASYCSAANGDLAPRAVVEKYCSLDSAGARLGSATCDAVAPLRTWEMEGGWDCLDAIAGFKIEPAIMDSDSTAAVTVRFDILGSLDGSKWDPAVPDSLGGRRETVTFRLIRDSRRGWRIDDPSYRPHVALAPVIDHIEKLLMMDPRRAASDPDLVQALASLRSLRSESAGK